MKWIISKGIEPSPEVKELAVQQNGWAIQYINNPSYKLQRLAVQRHGWTIELIIDKQIKPSYEIIKIVLTHPDVILGDDDIDSSKHSYDDLVKRLLPTSSLLVNKWIRYGDRIRGRINENN